MTRAFVLPAEEESLNLGTQKSLLWLVVADEARSGGHPVLLRLHRSSRIWSTVAAAGASSLRERLSCTLVWAPWTLRVYNDELGVHTAVDGRVVEFAFRGVRLVERPLPVAFEVRRRWWAQAVAHMSVPIITQPRARHPSLSPSREVSFVFPPLRPYRLAGHGSGGTGCRTVAPPLLTPELLCLTIIAFHWQPCWNQLKSIVSHPNTQYLHPYTTKKMDNKFSDNERRGRRYGLYLGFLYSLELAQFTLE
jgi:hypothetical protein